MTKKEKLIEKINKLLGKGKPRVDEMLTTAQLEKKLEELSTEAPSKPLSREKQKAKAAALIKNLNSEDPQVREQAQKDLKKFNADALR